MEARQRKGASLRLGVLHALFKATAVSGPTGPIPLLGEGKKFVGNIVFSQSISESLLRSPNWPLT
jgi:hypothetical protein